MFFALGGVRLKNVLAGFWCIRESVRRISYVVLRMSSLRFARGRDCVLRVLNVACFT